MKKVILFLVVSCLALSCKPKYEGVWRGTLTATVDGADMTFNVNTNVSRGSSSGTGAKLVTVSGQSEKASDEIYLELSSLTGIVPGIYREDGTAGGKEARLSYYENGRHFPFMTHKNAGNAATVTITAVSENVAQGTFSGDVFLLELQDSSFIATSVKKTITGGRFDLRFR